MLLSQTTEYALRAVVWLASREGTAQLTKQIAAGTRVPPGYLAKILQTLGRAGVVTSQRGVGGGFLLARAASALSVLAVINAVDPLRRIEKCPLDDAAHCAGLCPLHQRIDDAIAAVERVFNQTTIAELKETFGQHKPPSRARRRGRRTT